MPSRIQTLAVRRKDQLDALTSPVRVDVVDWLQSEGPQSISEIAAGLDRAPSSLYYHLDKLVSVGLVTATKTRPGRTRDAKVYELVAEKIVVEPSARRAIGALADSADAVLRKAGREYRRAVTEGDATQPSAARMRGRLSAKARTDIEKHLMAIQRIFLDERKKPGGTPFALTAILAPLETSERKA